MIFLCVIQLVISLGYLSFGYQIVFRGEYSLVRGYKKGKGFALRAGIIELFGGIATLATLPCTYLFGDMYFFLPIGITTVLFYMNKLTKK